MKKSKEFKIGDKVFAKVKGYPPWPAHITGENGKKYQVEFYGTKETGLIKGEDICYYLKNKDTYSKHAKRAGYADAMEEIEEDIQKSGGDGDEGSENVQNGNNSVMNASTDSTKPERKAQKRKTISSDEEAPPLKKSGRRTKSIASSESEVKEEIDSEGNETPSKTTVPEKTQTRRGRSNKSESKNIKEEEKTQNTTKEEENEIEPEFVSTGNDANTETEGKAITEETVTSVDKMLTTDEPSSDKVDVVLEKTLNHNILYAGHVRKSESHYKNQSVEPREDSEIQVLPVKLPSGVICGLKLHKNWPPSFENEYERALYDEEVAKTLLKDKEALLNSEKNVEDIESVIPNIGLSADDVKEITFNKEIELKKHRIERLKLEANLIELDSKIKNCLGLDMASPKIALNHLIELLEIDFDALMLKKHPHVVDMIRRLCKYVGNVKEWQMSDQEKAEFQKDAEKIRKEALKVYSKIKEIIQVPENSTSFWDGFLVVVSKFRDECKNLTESQIYVLCAEPKSRKAFMDQLEEVLENDNKESSVSKSTESDLNTADEVSSVQGWAEKSNSKTAS